MNNMRVIKFSTLAVLALGVLLQSCGLFGGGSTDRGELVGVLDRQGWEMTRPVPVWWQYLPVLFTWARQMKMSRLLKSILINR